MSDLIQITSTEIETIPQMVQTDIKDIAGVFQTVTSAPTHVPKKFIEQVLIVNSGGYKLYLYDTISNAWKYATLA
jgi:hypothetical protein